VIAFVVALSLRSADLCEEIFLREKQPSYRFGRDSSGKVVGFLWQNANMRLQLELNGRYISLDAMKRKIVSCNWPYMGVALLDPDHNLFVGAEGICAAERNEAYVFVMQAILEMTPKLKQSDIKIIAADGLLSPGLLAKAGVPSNMYDDSRCLPAVSAGLTNILQASNLVPGKIIVS
jgi:hypothetical protein